MSDYDEWGRFLLISGIIGFITLPLWIVPYGIWWLIKHEDWECEEKEREDRNKAWREAHPRMIVKPRFWRSIKQKEQWIADHPDIE
jgi:hypothetical protein